jgi:hypothetical protein
MSDDNIVNIDATPPHGDFYVTATDDFRISATRAPHVRALLGPYEDLRDALADVPRGRTLALDRDPRAAFYLYGVSRVAIGTNVSVIFP